MGISAHGGNSAANELHHVTTVIDLYPQWDWATRDGAKALELLMPMQHVTVFYGHIQRFRFTRDDRRRAATVARGGS